MKAKVKRMTMLTIIAMWILIGTQTQRAQGFEPTNIKITPIPVNIPCGGSGRVEIEITGNIAVLDCQARFFQVRLVDGDMIEDDILGVVTFDDPEEQWVPGQQITFTWTFGITCEDCTITGFQSSGESEAELALEIDAGRSVRKDNYFDTAAGTYVPVRCVKGVGGVWVPVDKFGLVAPYIGLASTILVATAATAIYTKRVKRRKEKQ